jgi:hypothetical protein
MNETEWVKKKNLAWKFINKADYKKAVGVLAGVYKKYPADFKVANFYASTLADYAELLSGEKKKKLKKEGISILSNLLKRTRGISKGWIYRTRNEYYYQTKNYYKQYMLGVEMVTNGDKNGFYSQGVGAAWHALELVMKGNRNKKRSKVWAKKAINAWNNYFKYVAKDYYNPYVHYALAFGILGNDKEMNKSLFKASKLSGKPLSYYEFKEVINSINLLKTKKD